MTVWKCLLQMLHFCERDEFITEIFGSSGGKEKDLHVLSLMEISDAPDSPITDACEIGWYLFYDSFDGFSFISHAYEGGDN